MCGCGIAKKRDAEGHDVERREPFEPIGLGYVLGLGVRLWQQKGCILCHGCRHWLRGEGGGRKRKAVWGGRYQRRGHRHKGLF